MDFQIVTVNCVVTSNKLAGSDWITLASTCIVAIFTVFTYFSSKKMANIESNRRKSEVPCIQYQVKGFVGDKYYKIMIWNNSITPTTIIDHYFLIITEGNEITHNTTASVLNDKGQYLKVRLPITLKSGEGLALYYTLGTNNNLTDLRCFPSVCDKWEEYSNNWSSGKVQADVFEAYLNSIKFYMVFNNIRSNTPHNIDLAGNDVWALCADESAKKLEPWKKEGNHV